MCLMVEVFFWFCALAFVCCMVSFTGTIALLRIINLIVILTKISPILPEVNVKNNYFELFRL